MQTRITKRVVDAAKPEGRDAFLWDSEVKGFGLKVTPKGRRVYVLQARVKGRLRRYTIGVHGSPWTPEKAREEAIRLRGEIAGGDDPANARAKEGRDMTVAALCDLYLKEGFATKKATTEAVERGLIARHIKPLLRNRTLASLGKSDIERFLADVAAGKTATDEKTKKRGRAIVKGGKGTANRTTALLASMLSFAVDRGYMPSNPARGVRLYRLAARERFLSANELKALGEALSACEAEGQNASAIAAIRLLLLTGCRKSEVLSLEWGWIDFERSLIRFPDSKTGAKVLPLGAPALAILNERKRVEGNPYVFPSTKTDGHLIGLAKVWRKVRTKAALPDVRLHDLRHSFASVGAAGGDSLYIVGKLLGHTQSRTTQRYAHLADDPVRAAAGRISEHIAAALGTSPPGKVVSIRR